MKHYLDEVLENGEKILWEGKPEPFKLLEGTDKKSILTKWILLGAVYILAVGGYLANALARGDSFTSTIMLALVLTGFAGLLIIAPISDRKVLVVSTKYAITDRRVIVVNKDGNKSMPLNKQTRCKVTHLENHTDVICFGEACNTKVNNIRSIAVRGVSEGKEKAITGLVLYSISDAKDICMKNTPCYMV